MQARINEPVTLVVKCKDNETDPKTFIQIIKFEEKRKERKTELAKQNWVGNVSEGNMTLVPFDADTYGKTSYILTMQPQEGEFGVRILNPNVTDEKVPIFNCFGIHTEDNNDKSAIDIKDESAIDIRTSYFYEVEGTLNPVYKTEDGRYYIYISKNKVKFLPKNAQLQEQSASGEVL